MSCIILTYSKPTNLEPKKKIDNRLTRLEVIGSMLCLYSYFRSITYSFPKQEKNLSRSQDILV